MSFDAPDLQRALATHGRVARVVIAAHQGSSPREAGASMLVWQGGQSGTIGGGALELDAAQRARSATTNSVTRIPLGPALGQCCGGAVTLVTEVFEAMPKIGASFTRQIKTGTDKPLSITRAEANTRNGEGTIITFENGWLHEVCNPSREDLWVWGAGHVGRAIIDVLAPTKSLNITWVDSDLARFPDTSPPPLVTPFPVANIPDAARHAPHDAHHLVLTYSHVFDLEICHRLLSRGFKSLGLIGSTTKWARFQSRLRILNHTDAQISRITCPIGQPALGKHPQAIAVGVASELLMTLQTQTLGEEIAV